MNQILSPIDHKVYQALTKINVTVDTCDHGFSQYTYGILSVYDKDLTIQEIDDSENLFEEYNLAYEASYVHFIQDVYEKNKNSTVLVETRINELDNATLMRILTLLDYRDKLMFIDFIKNYSNSAFIVRNSSILSLLTKLATRELLFSTFHFLKTNVTICCQPDLKFSLFVSDFSNLDSYIDIARDNDLYLRDIHVKY